MIALITLFSLCCFVAGESYGLPKSELLTPVYGPPPQAHGHPVPVFLQSAYLAPAPAPAPVPLPILPAAPLAPPPPLIPFTGSFGVPAFANIEGEDLQGGQIAPERNAITGSTIPFGSNTHATSPFAPGSNKNVASPSTQGSNVNAVSSFAPGSNANVASPVESRGNANTASPIAQGINFNAGVPVNIPDNSKIEIRDNSGQYTHGFNQAGTQISEQGKLITTNGGWEYVIAKKGSYSYVSPEGRRITVNYIADHNGYRVLDNPDSESL